MAMINSVAIRSAMNLNVSSQEIKTLANFNEQINSIKAKGIVPDLTRIFKVLSHMETYMQKKDIKNDTKLTAVKNEYDNAKANLRTINTMSHNKHMESAYTPKFLASLLNDITLALKLKTNPNAGWMENQLILGVNESPKMKQLTTRMNNVLDNIQSYTGTDKGTISLFTNFKRDVATAYEQSKKTEPSSKEKVQIAMALLKS